MKIAVTAYDDCSPESENGIAIASTSRLGLLRWPHLSPTWWPKARPTSGRPANVRFGFGDRLGIPVVNLSVD
jgi:hypothetical protein